MTIRQFQAKAEEFAEKGDYISCKVEMSHGSVNFIIWSGNIGTHFYSDTPEGALDKLRNSNEKRDPVDMEITEDSITIKLADGSIVEPFKENVLQEEITGDFFKGESVIPPPEIKDSDNLLFKGGPDEYGIEVGSGPSNTEEFAQRNKKHDPFEDIPFK